VRGAAAVLLLAIAGVAHADGLDDAMRQAGALAAASRWEEAAAALVAIADGAPADPRAADALAEAARLREDHLADPVGAVALYERLAREHPESRLALRAQRRAEALRAAVGPGGRDAAALVELEQILASFSTRPRAESVARMRRLVDENRAFADRPRALHWLGETARHDGRLAEAEAAYREIAAAYPGTLWAARAEKGLGDIALARGDEAAAARAYRALAAHADPSLAQIGREALAAMAAARRARLLGIAAWAALAVLLAVALLGLRRDAGGLAAAGRALLRPPLEACLLAPLGAVAAWMTFERHPTAGRAVAWLLGGALAVTWISGAGLRAARRRDRLGLGRALLHLAGCGLAILAVAYLVVTRTQVLETVIITLREGAE
jgi:hypothetical protein